MASQIKNITYSIIDGYIYHFLTVEIITFFVRYTQQFLKREYENLD